MNENLFMDWADVTLTALQSLWRDVLGFLPNLIGAVFILLLGLIIASVLATIVSQIIRYLKIDDLLKKAEVEEYFSRADLKLDTGYFLGRLTYWFVVIAFLLAAADILNFTAFSQFLNVILAFIPNVIIAALILLATLVIAHFLNRLVVASITSAKLHYARGIGILVWWVVFIFGFLAALDQIGINITVIQSLITGLIAMLSIAGGLAFGLGGKENAKAFLDRMSSQMRK